MSLAYLLTYLFGVEFWQFYVTIPYIGERVTCGVGLEYILFSKLLWIDALYNSMLSCLLNENIIPM